MNERTEVRKESLLAWQWRSYRDAHQERKNLVVHACTVPFFIAGTACVIAAPWVGPRWALAGAMAALAAIGAQGRTHRLEPVRPAPFRGLADILARLLAEQWITFPRFVLSGWFLRAWRAVGERERLSSLP